MRKPGAFENYRYQEDLFPTSRFRMAYEALWEATPNRSSKEYLKILKLAAEAGEVQVDEALRELLERKTVMRRNRCPGHSHDNLRLVSQIRGGPVAGCCL